MPSSLNVVLLSLLLATPLLIFWLCLVSLPARVAILCPVECECELLGYQVKYIGPSLTAISLIGLTNVQALSLNKINITFSERDSFVLLTDLEELFVRWCGLREVELGHSTDLQS